MKKLLLMAFVSMALLTATSCSKGDETKPEPEPAPQPTVTGTAWECVHTFSVSVFSATVTMDLEFTTDETCLFSFAMEPDYTALLPFDIPDSGEFAYTFDGELVVVKTGTALGDMNLEYVSNRMLIYTVPENFRQYTGTSELVFHAK